MVMADVDNTPKGESELTARQLARRSTEILE